MLEDGEVDFHGLDVFKGRLIHDDGRNAFQVAVKAAGVRGNFADPFVVDVHAGLDLVVRRGVALVEGHRFAVDADGVDPEVVAGEQVFAVLEAQGRKGKATSGVGEFQADGVIAFAGHGGVGGGHALRVGSPVLGGPGGISVHDVGHGGGLGFFHRFFFRLFRGSFRRFGRLRQFRRAEGPGHRAGHGGKQERCGQQKGQPFFHCRFLLLFY